MPSSRCLTSLTRAVGGFFGWADSLVPELSHFTASADCSHRFVWRSASDVGLIVLLSAHHDLEAIAVAARLLPRSTGFICSTSL